MNAEAKTLADELRTIARCIYIAVEKTVADDIAGKATKAADFLDRPVGGAAAVDIAVRTAVAALRLCQHDRSGHGTDAEAVRYRRSRQSGRQARDDHDRCHCFFFRTT